MVSGTPNLLKKRRLSSSGKGFVRRGNLAGCRPSPVSAMTKGHIHVTQLDSLPSQDVHQDFKVQMHQDPTSKVQVHQDISSKGQVHQNPSSKGQVHLDPSSKGQVHPDLGSKGHGHLKTINANKSKEPAAQTFEQTFAQFVQNSPKPTIPVVQHGHRSSPSVQLGPKSSTRVHRGPKSFTSVQNCPKSSTSVQRGPKSTSNSVRQCPKSMSTIQNGPKSSNKRQLSSTSSQGLNTPSKKKLISSKNSSIAIQPNISNSPSNSARKQDPSIESTNLTPVVVLQKYVIRPVPSSATPEFVQLQNGGNHRLTKDIWHIIFSKLCKSDLTRCIRVCKVWHRWCLNPRLWECMVLSGKRICQPHLVGIVKRQPLKLGLSSVTMTQQQFIWLLARIPCLRHLTMCYCAWATVSALCIGCPLLSSLNLSWVIGLGEQEFKDVIMPPVDRLPGMLDISRLHLLKSLSLAGTEINDSSLSLMGDLLKRLEVLDLSYCAYVTNDGMDMLLTSDKSVCKTLKQLNLSGCRHITEGVIDTLNACEKLVLVHVKHCRGLASSAVKKASLGAKISFLM